MDALELGELRPVDVRAVWEHEAHNFTPWLAGNLYRLSDTLGLDLEPVDTEVRVGPYRADIVCRVPADGTVVLIENQLEHADLQHLGQVLAYLAGLEAKVVVWIAKGFDDAHLSALRWLNEHTPEQFSFLAVRVGVLRIGDSLPAPVFEVIERPNDWDRIVRETYRSLSDLEKLRRDFWTHLAECHPDGPNPRPGFASNNAYHRLPEPDVRMCQYVIQRSVGIYLKGRTGESDDAMLTRLMPQLGSLREALQDAFEQDRLGAIDDDSFRDGTAEDFKCLVWLRIDPGDRRNWDQMADWLDHRRRIYTEVLRGEPLK